MKTSYSGRFGAGLLLVSLILGTGAGVGVEVLSPSASGALTSGLVTVTTPADAPLSTDPATKCDPTDPTDGPCTLRAAVAYFNGAGSDVTIDLPDPESLVPAQDAYLVESTSGELDVDGTGTLNVAYSGANGADANIDAQQVGGDTPDINIFDIDAGTTVNITGLTLQDGNNPVGYGGAITNDGTLDLSNSDVSQNTAQDGGGGISQNGDGSMILTDDTIAGNDALNGDGGGVDVLAGSVTITGGTIGGGLDGLDGNFASGSGGGVALESGVSSLSDVTIGGTVSDDGNTASTSGGPPLLLG